MLKYVASTQFIDLTGIAVMLVIQTAGYIY